MLGGRRKGGCATNRVQGRFGQNTAPLPGNGHCRYQPSGRVDGQSKNDGVFEATSSRSNGVSESFRDGPAHKVPVSALHIRCRAHHFDSSRRGFFGGTLFSDHDVPMIVRIPELQRLNLIGDVVRRRVFTCAHGNEVDSNNPMSRWGSWCRGWPQRRAAEGK